MRFLGEYPAFRRLENPELQRLLDFRQTRLEERRTYSGLLARQQAQREGYVIELQKFTKAMVYWLNEEEPRRITSLKSAIRLLDDDIRQLQQGLTTIENDLRETNAEISRLQGSVRPQNVMAR